MKKLGKLLFITSLLLCFLIPRGWTQTQAKNQPDSIELKLKEIYTKREVMIPMRDGIKLYTAVYEPKDNSRQHPIRCTAALTLVPHTEKDLTVISELI